MTSLLFTTKRDVSYDLYDIKKNILTCFLEVFCAFIMYHLMYHLYHLI